MCYLFMIDMFLPMTMIRNDILFLTQNTLHHYVMLILRWSNQVFHKHTTLAIMPKWHQRLYYVKTKKSSDKMLPPVRIDPRPLMSLWFQVQHSPFWANLTFACKTETLGSLYSHALLILTKWCKSKNQVMHEQKFKDLLSITEKLLLAFCHALVILVKFNLII